VDKDAAELLATKRVWRLHQVRSVLPAVSLPGVVGSGSPSHWGRWYTEQGIPVGTPYFIAPTFEYDVQLNEFFYSVDMLGARLLTRIGYARDLKGFLNFLHFGRDGKSWRDASEEDHRAYLIWRREDPLGPRVSPSTWDREVAAVSRFYRWQVASGNIRVSPIPQRLRRSGHGFSQHGQPRETAASYSHGARREEIRWLPARSYRQWRDVGLRGYDSDGLPDRLFRGRWADRNATFTDLMVRTGMRLTEQASLSVFEIPTIREQSGYHRFWLPEAIAKSGSDRWVYIPSAILRDLHAYMDLDRRTVIARAQAQGRYKRAGQDYLVLDDRRMTTSNLAEESARLSQLTPMERQRLLVAGPNGLEPASLWLTEDGAPMSVSSWKDIFRQANLRCEKHGVSLHAHAHMLRHSFAVLTLEQLQRGHITSLAQLNPAQRGQYTRVFGDPLDWVRRRLGHKSVTTTQIYLHALEELEMETRMALTSDAWEDPRDPQLIANLKPSTVIEK